MSKMLSIEDMKPDRNIWADFSSEKKFADSFEALCMSKEAVHVVDKEAAILCQSITWLNGGREE